jgi:hypothetical protein
MLRCGNDARCAIASGAGFVAAHEINACADVTERRRRRRRSSLQEGLMNTEDAIRQRSYLIFPS